MASPSRFLPAFCASHGSEICRLALPKGPSSSACPHSVVSASVSAFVFGGITSAGSSYIVQLLHGVFQLPMVASVFLVQVFTDYADKFLILVIVTLIIQRIPQG